MKNTTEFYTPELNEFHVGFEYESTDDFINWRPKIFDNLDFRSVELMLAYGVFDKKTSRVRVKKLSKECIESFGWEFVNSAFGDYCLNNKYFLTYRNESIKIGYDEGFQVWTNVCRGVPCKNKSELSKLMTMLNIKI